MNTLSGQSAPLFTVVIPTCHRNGDLAECLRRLAPGAQTLDPAYYVVVVTDDGSKGTAEAMIRDQFPWVRWVEGPRRGPAANRNRGAAEAKTDWIAFTDDDCLPTPQFLAAYEQAVRQFPTTLIFEGRTSADRVRRHPFEGAPINPAGGQLWSCNLAIARRFFKELRGFNEAFPFAAMEDLDFSRRVKLSGMISRFVPEAEIVHPWRMLDLKNHTRKHVASQLIYARLHPDEKHLFTFRQHCKNVARYYLRDFPAEVREFGWLALRCQPLRWWEIGHRSLALVKGDKAHGKAT